MIDSEWRNHPSKLLLDAVCDACAAAALTERRVLDIADRLASVGLDRLADECTAAVAGLTEATKRARDAHSVSQSYDLRESERGVANILTAIVRGNIGPARE